MVMSTRAAQAMINSAPADDAREVIFDTEINAKSLYVGVQGDLTVVTAYGNTVTFVNAVDWIPIRVKQVLNDSTAENIIALF